MAEEVTKLLGPFPILQLLFGLIILGFGAFMIVRGAREKSEGKIQLEDKRLEWLAYEHLRNVEENSFKMVELQKQTLEQLRHLEDQMKALASAIWNRGV